MHPLLILAALAGVTGTEALLERARAEYEALEFERVVRTTDALSGAAVDGGAFLEAQVLRGSALAILGRIVDAEAPFRLVLRARPDFDMPEDTPPKILAVFRKVQVDERRLAAELEQLRRQRLGAELEVTPRLPEVHPGGLALPVEVQIVDPHRGAGRVTLSFRLGLVGDYDVVSLARDGDRWHTELGADRTSSPDGDVLCWFVDVYTADGRHLLGVGSAPTPRTIEVTPGVVSDHAPVTSRWWFWAGLATVVAAGAASAAVIVRSQGRLPDSDLGEVSFQ